MNFLSFVNVEFKKIRRSKIFLILILANIILWLPSIFDSDIHFSANTTQSFAISPENSFFIQGFMPLAWFVFPATMVVVVVLQSQIERKNQGILKMLTLPINTAKICMAKFIVLFLFSVINFTIATAMYYITCGIVSQIQEYNIFLPLTFVLNKVFIMWFCSIPMLAFFWMISVCIYTPIFSIMIGFASIVPSIIMINTKIWFLYPMSYIFYFVTAEYGKLADNLSTAQIELFPWILIAIFITIICLLISCIRFGKGERR